MEHSDAADLLDLAARLCEQGRYTEALDHLDRAGAILRTAEDTGLLARVDETRARVFLAERKYGEARRVIDRAIETLERGGEVTALAGALTTRGVVLARLGDNEGSVDSLRRAVELAEWAGDLTGAGLAALTLIEEHGARRAFPPRELYELYLRADRSLGDARPPDTAARRPACARVVMRRLAGVEPGDQNFTSNGALHEFEEKLVGWALGEAGGERRAGGASARAQAPDLRLDVEPEAQEALGEAHAPREAAVSRLNGRRLISGVRRLTCERLNRDCIQLVIGLSCRPPHLGTQHLARYPFYRLKTREVYGRQRGEAQ